MLKGKKNEPCRKPGSGSSHSRAGGSRNQFSTKAPKGNTLQVPSKVHVTRTTKSPAGGLKKPLDSSVHDASKAAALPRHSAPKKLAHEVRAIKAEISSSSKKSLSNNDSNTSPSQEEVFVQKGCKKQLHKRHFLSSEQPSSNSPTRDANEKERRKNIMAGPKKLNNEYRINTNIKTTNASPQNKDPEPWVDFLYAFTKTIRKNKKENEAKLRDYAEENKLELCLKLVKQRKSIDIDSKNCDGWTALHLAVNEGNLEVAKLLLDEKANIEARTKQMRTPLHVACCRGDLRAVQMLVERRANLTAQDIEGNTCLHILARYAMDKVIEWLVSQSDISGLKTIRNNAKKLPSEVTTNARVLELLGAKNSDQTEVGETKQVQVYHTNQLCINKYMGGLSKPTGDASDGSDEEPSSLMSSCTTLNEGEKNIRVVYSSNTNGHLVRPQEKIGPESFIVHQVLGKGSFGEVYLVEKISSHRLYAMKVLSKMYIMSQNLVKYTVTERDVLAVTNHPFIVGLNYAFQTNKKLFLILDYCPGGDLSEYIEREKRFTEDRARIYLAEILLALEDLHKRDIIYRDLKPDNVILDGEGHAMLTDFGLSKQGIINNSSAKSFCGSVAYLAPEMIKRAGHGKAVDWYLLGVLMYEMLVGQPPYFHKDKYWRCVLVGSSCSRTYREGY